MHATDRISYGTVYFPIAFGLLVYIYWDRNPAIWLTAMLILSFADTMATLVGERIADEKKFILWVDKKSLGGSSAFFITALLIVLLAFPIFTRISGMPVPGIGILLILGVLTAFIATLTEAVSRQGSDNLTLTLSAAFMLDLILYNYNEGILIDLCIWILFSAIMFVVAYKLRSLTLSGAIGAFILGTFIFGLGGWQTVIPLVVFFVLSSILSKIADRNKQNSAVTVKGSES